MENFREQLKVEKERAVLAGAILRGREKNFDDLTELAALAQTAGAIVVYKFQQKVREINASTFIGKGKAEQLAEKVVEHNADVVIFDNDLSPGQIRSLEEIMQVKVLDRSELILDIFATHARTRQAKVQVELAQLEYTYPRLTRMWSHLDTVTGGAGAGGSGAAGAAVGTRGTGEKQLEIDRRLVSKRVTELKSELKEIDKRKIREIESRKGQFKICIVGYTNSGKSTLMNALTDAGVLVEDKLFATLDTKTKKWNLQAGMDVLLSDTVGFVKHLPHHLVASFKATLEEAVYADVLLHVVDASNEDAMEHIASVNAVLKQLGCGHKPEIMLLNKTDKISRPGQLDMISTLHPDAICISAKTGVNLELLSEAILKRFKGREVIVKVSGGNAYGKIHSYLCANATILDEEYEDNRYSIQARIGRNQLTELKRLKPENLEIDD